MIYQMYQLLYIVMKLHFVIMPILFLRNIAAKLRQAGFIAATGIYALDNNITRLKEDHKRAKES